MSSRREWTYVFGVVAVLAVGPAATASAAEPSSSNNDVPVRSAGGKKDPEALIREGNDLRKQGRNEEALPLFQAAYAAARTPRTAGQLGLCEMSVGYSVEAEAHLAEALEFPNHPWVAKNAAGLRDMLAKARQKIVEIDVTGSPVGAELRVNGHVVGTLPLGKPLRLAEGPIDVQAVAPGYRTDLRTLSAKGGDRLAIAFNLVQDIATTRTEKGDPLRIAQPSDARGTLVKGQHDQVETRPAPTPPALTSERSVGLERGPRWPAVTSASAGVLAVGFGAVELYLWRHAQNSFNNHLAPKPGSPGMYQHDCGEQDPMRGGTGCQDLYNEAVRSRTLAVLGFAAGAAFAITSVVLWPSNHGIPSPEQKVSCLLNPVDRGVECRWHF
jgi:hypothetical protein